MIYTFRYNQKIENFCERVRHLNYFTTTKKKIYGILNCSLIIGLFFPVYLYSKEPYLNAPKATFNNTELVLVIQLINGLNLDRMVIIEKGRPVELIFIIRVYKKRTLLPDEVISVESDNETQLDQIKITKQLNYDYLTKNYIVKRKTNYLSNVIVNKFYSGEDIKESYKILKEKYFKKKVSVFLSTSQIQLSRKYSYYISVTCEFKAVPIYNPLIKIPNPFNFKTSSVETEIKMTNNEE